MSTPVRNKQKRFSGSITLTLQVKDNNRENARVVTTTKTFHFRFNPSKHSTKVIAQKLVTAFVDSLTEQQQQYVKQSTIESAITQQLATTKSS